jgi:hypothetical protein
MKFGAVLPDYIRSGIHTTPLSSYISSISTKSSTSSTSNSSNSSSSSSTSSSSPTEIWSRSPSSYISSSSHEIWSRLAMKFRVVLPSDIWSSSPSSSYISSSYISSSSYSSPSSSSSYISSSYISSSSYSSPSSSSSSSVILPTGRRSFHSSTVCNYPAKRGSATTKGLKGANTNNKKFDRELKRHSIMVEDYRSLLDTYPNLQDPPHLAVSELTLPDTHLSLDLRKDLGF